MVFLNLDLKLTKLIYKTISSNPYTNPCELSKKKKKMMMMRGLAIEVLWGQERRELRDEGEHDGQERLERM